MRTQCTICTDYFEPDSEISALVACGHTFHHGCVSEWLRQSATCPQCRKPVHRKTGIIPKLFFNQAEAEEADSDADSSALQNELSSARLALRSKDREKSQLKEETNKQISKLQEQIKDLGDNYKSMDMMYKMECTSNQALRREVSFHKKMQKEAEYAKEDAVIVRKKLKDLQAVETLIKNNEDEVDDMIRNQGDVKQLAIWCITLQKELNTKRHECRSLRAEVDKWKKEAGLKKRAFLERTGELTSARDHMKVLEDDLKNSDSQLVNLKKKIEMLERAVGSPSDTAASFAHRLIHESPAPFLPPKKKPRLSAPLDGGDEINLDVTMELFSSPECDNKNKAAQNLPKSADVISEPSPNTHRKRACEEYGMQYVKISSAASNPTSRKPERDLLDIGNTMNGALSNFNLFKKKNAVGKVQEPSIIRKGYNGLGGHETIVQPFPRPKGLLAPAGQKKTNTFGPAKSVSKKPVPQLPNIDGFLD